MENLLWDMYESELLVFILFIVTYIQWFIDLQHPKLWITFKYSFQYYRYFKNSVVSCITFWRILLLFILPYDLIYIKQNFWINVNNILYAF